MDPTSHLECPAPEGAPTLNGELRRGVNPFNLKFGAVAAMILGTGIGLGLNSWTWAIATILGLFLALTLIHTLAHGFMGWLFERGLKLHCHQHYARAVRWLWLAEKSGMDHYDPHGVALDALRDCREKMSVP